MDENIKQHILSCTFEEDVYEIQLTATDETVIYLCLYKRLELNGTLEFAREVINQVSNIDHEIVGMIYRECICNYKEFRENNTYIDRLKEIGSIIDYTMACMSYYEQLSTDEIYNIIINKFN